MIVGQGPGTVVPDKAVGSPARAKHSDLNGWLPLSMRMRGKAVVRVLRDSMMRLARLVRRVDMDDDERQIAQMMQQLVADFGRDRMCLPIVSSGSTAIFSSTCKRWPSQRARTSVTSFTCGT